MARREKTRAGYSSLFEGEESWCAATSLAQALQANTACATGYQLAGARRAILAGRPKLVSQPAPEVANSSQACGGGMQKTVAVG